MLYIHSFGDILNYSKKKKEELSMFYRFIFKSQKDGAFDESEIQMEYVKS